MSLPCIAELPSDLPEESFDDEFPGVCIRKSAVEDILYYFDKNNCLLWNVSITLLTNGIVLELEDLSEDYGISLCYERTDKGCLITDNRDDKEKLLEGCCPMERAVSDLSVILNSPYVENVWKLKITEDGYKQPEELDPNRQIFLTHFKEALSKFELKDDKKLVVEKLKIEMRIDENELMSILSHFEPEGNLKSIELKGLVADEEEVIDKIIDSEYWKKAERVKIEDWKSFPVSTMTHLTKFYISDCESIVQLLIDDFKLIFEAAIHHGEKFKKYTFYAVDYDFHEISNFLRQYRSLDSEYDEYKHIEIPESNTDFCIAFSGNYIKMCKHICRFNSVFFPCCLAPE